MVAKIKSSFLKNSFQFFCYKNFIHKDVHNNDDFNNNYNKPIVNGILKKQNHSKSSPNLNNNINNSSNQNNNNNDLNSTTTNNNNKNEFYMNNRKQLSKILNGKLKPEDLIQLNNHQNNNGNNRQSNNNKNNISNSGNNTPTNKLTLDDIDQAFELKSKQYPNSQMSKSATLPTPNSNNNELLINRHSYTIDEQNSNMETNNNNNKSFKADLMNSNNSSLYKNQSIAGLKLAKKMQLMNKSNNGESVTMNGTLSSKPILTHSKSRLSKNSILISRRSFSASQNHNSKKVVRFADALGLELESIITLSHNNTIIMGRPQPAQPPPATSTQRPNRFSLMQQQRSNYQSVNQYQHPLPSSKSNTINNSNNNKTYQQLPYQQQQQQALNRNTINAYYNINGNYGEFVDTEYINQQKQQKQTKEQKQSNSIASTPSSSFDNSSSTNSTINNNYTNMISNDDTKFYDDLMSHLESKNNKHNNDSNHQSDETTINKIKLNDLVQPVSSVAIVNNFNNNKNLLNNGSSEILIVDETKKYSSPQMTQSLSAQQNLNRIFNQLENNLNQQTQTSQYSSNNSAHKIVNRTKSPITIVKTSSSSIQSAQQNSTIPHNHSTTTTTTTNNNGSNITIKTRLNNNGKLESEV